MTKARVTEFIMRDNIEPPAVLCGYDYQSKGSKTKVTWTENSLSVWFL